MKQPTLHEAEAIVITIAKAAASATGGNVAKCGLTSKGEKALLTITIEIPPRPAATDAEPKQPLLFPTPSEYPN